MNPRMEKALNLPTYQKVLIALVACLLVFGLFWLLVFQPMKDDLDSLGERRDTLERKLNEDRRIASNLPKFRAEYEKLEAQLAIALKELPNQKEIPAFLVRISDLAKNSGLEVVEFKPGGIVPKGFYAEVPVALRLVGSYHEIAMFCFQVGNMTRIVNLSGLSLGSAKGTDGRNLLNIECQATTFQFVDAPPSKPKGKKKGRRR